MKKNKKYIYSFATVLMAGLLFFASCKKNTVDPDPSTVPLKSIIDLLGSDADFSIFFNAINKANLTSTLAAGSFTVFAPNNAAFKSYGLDSAKVVNMDPTMLANLIKYHIISSALKTKDFPVGVNTEITTLGGKAYITNYTYGKLSDGTSVSYGIALNGVRSDFPDIMATNGVVHRVDAVNMPLTSDLLTIVQANPKFSLFLQALNKAGLTSVLSSPGPITIFAPTNDAFAKYNIDALKITLAKPDTLANLLNYHIINGRIFLPDVTPGFIASDSKFKGSLSASVDSLPNLLTNHGFKETFADNKFVLTSDSEQLKAKIRDKMIADSLKKYNNDATKFKLDAYTPLTISSMGFVDLMNRPGLGATNGVLYEMDGVLIPKKP